MPDTQMPDDTARDDAHKKLKVLLDCAKEVAVREEQRRVSKILQEKAAEMFLEMQDTAANRLRILARQFEADANYLPEDDSLEEARQAAADYVGKALGIEITPWNVI